MSALLVAGLSLALLLVLALVSQLQYTFGQAEGPGPLSPPEDR